MYTCLLFTAQHVQEKPSTDQHEKKKMASRNELDQIISVDIENTFNFYTIYPKIQVIRPDKDLAGKLRHHKVLGDRVSIGIRDLEFVKRLNYDAAIMLKESERVKKMVLKKMLEQNDTDTLYLHKPKGRWDQKEFRQIRDNFIIEIKVTEEEIDFMRGVGVPERDMLTCVRLRTKQDCSTIATCVVWYDCSELLLPQGLKVRGFGVLVEDSEFICKKAESGNCHVVCISPTSKKGLKYLYQRLCLNEQDTEMEME